jgi:hypothetical protein
MDFEITIPDYLSINQFKQIESYEHLSELDRMVKILSIVSNKTEDELRELPSNSLIEIYSSIITKLTDVKSLFFPIFELNGVKYGFKSIAKMTLGEYIDLEMLAKKPLENIEEILAILYRPIVKDKFNTFKWALEHGVSVAKGQVEDIFKYYEIEKYDVEKRFDNAEVLKDMPAGFAIGALSFFLQVASLSLKSTQTSSQKNLSKKEMMKMAKEMVFPNTGDGLRLFISSQKVPSLTLQETKLLQI